MKKIYLILIAWLFSIITCIGATIVVTPVGSPTPSNNDFTVIQSSITAALTNDVIDLQGTFDWTETNALASYTGSYTLSPYSDIRGVRIPDNVHNLTITSSTHDGVIIGAGDIVDGALIFSSCFYNPGLVGINNLTVSYIHFDNFESSITLNWDAYQPSNGTIIEHNTFTIAGDDGDAIDWIQNIAVYFGKGINQKIQYNTFKFKSNGTRTVGYSGPATGASFGFQSATNPNGYDGLEIVYNTFQVESGSVPDNITYGIWENSHSDNNDQDILVSNNNFLGRPGDDFDRAFILSSQSDLLLIDHNTFDRVDNLYYARSNSGVLATDEFTFTNSTCTNVGGSDGIFLQNVTETDVHVTIHWGTNNTVEGETGIRGLNELSTQATHTSRPSSAATDIAKVFAFGDMPTAAVDDSWGTPARFSDPDGIGTGFDPVAYGFNTFTSIQAGINAVTSSTVYVNAGTFTENININKHISLIGSGSGNGGTIITFTPGDYKVGVIQLSASGVSSANPILIKDIRVQPVGMAGISVGRFTEETGTSVSYIKLDNVKVIGTNNSPCTEQERGLYVDLTSSLSYLEILNSSFDNLHYGWYLQKKVSTDASTVQYITVTNTTFNHNNFKGLYTEKLEDAVFTTCTWNNNGYAVIPGDCSYFNPWLSGVDVNLKAGTYQNLTFDGCTITNNGLGQAKEGVGITVKARDDGGTYGPFPATVSNVFIQNCTITGNERGIRFGEPGKLNTTPTNASVYDCDIYNNVKTYSGSDGSAYGGLVNQCVAPVSAIKNYWGHVSGPDHASNPHGTGQGGELVSVASGAGAVTCVPWYATSTTTPATEYVTVNHNSKDFSVIAISDKIQPGVDAALAGDELMIAAGTYVEQVFVNGKNNLTFSGATSNKADVIIKSPTTLTNFFTTSSNNYPVVFIKDVNYCRLRWLTVNGDYKGNTNYRFIGIGFWNSGGIVNQVDVFNIMENPFNGNQHGVGVYAYNNTGGPYTLTCSDMVIDNFQKNAMALNGAGLTANVTNISAIGEGPTSITAQNGVQFGWGSSGTVNNLIVSNIEYTGTGWTAAGFLAYEATSVSIFGMTTNNVQSSADVTNSDCALHNVVVNNPKGDGIVAYKDTETRGNINKLQISPYGEGQALSARGETLNISILDCILNGQNTTGKAAINIYTTNSGNVAAVMTNNLANNWDYGIYADDDGGNIYTYTANNNLAYNNYGFWTNTTYTLLAENNWWGDASGPYDGSDDRGTGGLYNPTGLGSDVTDKIDYDTWCTTPTTCIPGTTMPTYFLNVDQGVYYQTLQDAINAAAIGDVIQVTGTHNVHDIVVNKGLKIAAGAGGAHFSGLTGPRSGTGFTINTTDPVEFNGLSFEDYDLALDFIAFGSAVVTDCKFINNVQAIDNNTTTDIDAENNWWGAPTGPLDASPAGLYNPFGQGDPVTDYVDYQPWYNDFDLTMLPVDIKIVNPSCNKLDVYLRPNDAVNASLTNIQFAVKWTSAVYNGIVTPTFRYGNVSDGYIEFQYYATNGGYKYAVFAYYGDIASAWSAGSEVLILSLDLDQTGSQFSTTDFEIAQDAWALANNANYYIQLAADDRTGYIYGFADDVYTYSCNLELNAKVFLQGPYDPATNLMKTDIRDMASFSMTQPYNGVPWNHSGSELITSKPADLVDWVLVELRSDVNTPVYTEAGLLYKDGSIREWSDPTKKMSFTGAFVPNSDFYVVIYHRNHMPVMSSALVNIPNTPMLDLSLLTNAYYKPADPQNPLVNLETGVYGMIAGDIYGHDYGSGNYLYDGKLKYSGSLNDRGPILAKIDDYTGVPYINGVINNEYFIEDLTLNKQVKYSGSGNDPRLIIQNLIELVGSNDLTNVYSSKVPGWVRSTPKAGNNAIAGPLDIALIDSPQELLVNVRTNEALYEALTDNIQFTLCWDQANINIGNLVSSYTSDFRLEPQGEPVMVNGKLYQVFAMVDAILLPDPFIPGQEVTVMKFYKDAATGDAAGKVSIAQDGWTTAHNGDYYMSVWGVNRTGNILENALGIVDPTGKTSMSIYPNPVSQGWAYVTIKTTASENLTLTVSDITGRIVSVKSWSVTAGNTPSMTLDLQGLSKGAYTISVNGASTQARQRIIVQ
jgi:hypothetical protein